MIIKLCVNTCADDDWWMPIEKLLIDLLGLLSLVFYLLNVYHLAGCRVYWFWGQILYITWIMEFWVREVLFTVQLTVLQLLFDLRRNDTFWHLNRRNLIRNRLLLRLYGLFLLFLRLYLFLISLVYMNLFFIGIFIWVFNFF
jgi:hypothetical protein